MSTEYSLDVGVLLPSSLRHLGPVLRHLLILPLPRAGHPLEELAVQLVEEGLLLGGEVAAGEGEVA